jgi:hypothetical protein
MSITISLLFPPLDVILVVIEKFQPSENLRQIFVWGKTSGHFWAVALSKSLIRNHFGILVSDKFLSTLRDLSILTV